jgi:hypothetical protein
VHLQARMRVGRLRPQVVVRVVAHRRADRLSRGWRSRRLSRGWRRWRRRRFGGDTLATTLGSRRSNRRLPALKSTTFNVRGVDTERCDYFFKTWSKILF